MIPRPVPKTCAQARRLVVRLRRYRIALALAGLLGVLAVGRHVLDSATESETAPIPVTMTPTTIETPVIGPKRIERPIEKIDENSEESQPRAEETKHIETGQLEPPTSTIRPKSVKRGKRSQRKQSRAAPIEAQEQEQEPAAPTPPLSVAEFSDMRRWRDRTGPVLSTPPPGNAGNEHGTQ